MLMSESLRSTLEVALSVNLLLIGWIVGRELRRWRDRPARPVCLLKYLIPPSDTGPDDLVLVRINCEGLYLSHPPARTEYHAPIGKAITFRVTDDGEFRIERSER